ncbi:MAG TPA: hypothetical protein VII71_07585 [Verrucomicrobiae bacterium]
MKRPSDHEPPVAEDESPNLPWFRTWRGVYLFVIGCFVIDLLLLAILSWTFS